jgi:hypothetical protein
MKLIIFILLYFVTFNALADSRSYDRTWFGLFNKKNVEASEYSIWTEAQARMDNEYFNNQQLLLRGGLLKRLNEKNEVGLLYAYSETNETTEHRPTLQWSHTFLKDELTTVSLRNRLEYRKQEGNDTESARYRANLRYQRAQYIFWEELFLNVTREDWTGDRLVERNRFFIGPEIKFKGMNLEVGYMNQYTPREDRNTIEHILVVYLNY